MKNDIVFNLPVEEGGVYLPCVNEFASLYLGSSLVSPTAHPEMKAYVKETLSQMEERMSIRYEQNTADELNIAIPDSQILGDKRFQQMTEAQLEKISGGAFEIVALFTAIGTAMGVGIGVTGVTVATGAAGLTAGAAAATFTAVVTTTSLATTLAGLAVVGSVVAGAVAVTAAVGVGVAAGLGAFSGGGGGNVGVGLAS